MIRFLLSSLLLCSSCCQMASAQIELSYEIRKSLVGATNPEVLPGGRILIDADSKTSVSDLAVIKVASIEGVRLLVQRDGQKKPVGLTAYKSSSDPDSKIVTASYLLIGEGSYTVYALGRARDEWDRSVEIIIGPQPKPDPEPDPKPPPLPPPGPVTSFRVIFVKESGSTLTAEQTAIPNAKVVRDYLAAKTTPESGLPGWREYDPQQNVSNEQGKIKSLWLSAKPAIKTIPCMVIEVNGKATIVSYPKNVAEAVTILKGYGGE